MPEAALGRRNSLPVIYVRGTHYEVGFDIGRTFGSLISSLLSIHKPLNEEYLPAYETPEGEEIYQAALDIVKERFPQYIRELEGTADGAKVPFYKLFLLHLDDVLPNVVKQENTVGSNGCSTVCCNHQQQEFLGHTEDALSEVLNHTYIVNAHITESKRHEVFTSFCYAGLLPGYAMSYNHHGLVFSINIISAKQCAKGRIPRAFLMRALLSAETLVGVESILRDPENGSADAFSVNMTFLKQEGDRLFHNIEVAPALSPATESILSGLTVSPGEHMYHFNKFLRLSVPEVGGVIVSSSDARMETARSHPSPSTLSHVVNFLGDDNHPKFTVFRDSDTFVKTVAVGIFDCVERTWTIYLDNPKTSAPIVVLPISLL